MSSYELADTDELEALGRDGPMRDTSAALQPDESAMSSSVEAPSSAPAMKRPCCVFISVITLLVVAAIIVITVITQVRTSTGKPGKPGEDGIVTTDISTVSKFPLSVVAKLPHDPEAFTQGFEFANGVFYESTGLDGKSSLRKVNVTTGKVLQKFTFSDPNLFGEGMTLHTTHHIFMLTWRAGRGFIFNQTTFKPMGEWQYEGEGWGLCMDRIKNEVYMSDGTSFLRVLDPEDLSERRRVQVTWNGKPVLLLNEIEWICGEIWANVWQTSTIVRINPDTGVVKAVIDVSNLPLAEDRLPTADVLNGIAFDRTTGRLWLTGKKWPVIYQVSIKDPSLNLSECTNL